MSDITKLSNKEIDAKIAALQEESIGLSVDYMADKEYIALTHRLSEIKHEYLEQNAQRQDVISSEIENYTAELERRKNEKKKPVELSDRIAKLIDEMHRGAIYGPQGLIPVMVWDDRFILLKKPGHRGWSGRGSSTYIPTAYSLHDMKDFMDGCVVGCNLFYNSIIWEAPDGTTITQLRKNIDSIVETFRKTGQ